MSKKQITINFEDQQRTFQIIKVDNELNCKLSIVERMLNTKIVFHRLWVHIPNIPNGILIKDAAKLIQLKPDPHDEANRSISTELKNFSILNEKYVYDILCDTSQILDYTGTYDEVAFSFILYGQREQNVQEQELKTFDIVFTFKKAHPKPKIELRLEEPFASDTFVYARQGWKRLATLSIRNTTRIQCSHPLECDLQVDCQELPSSSIIKNLVAFEKSSESLLSASSDKLQTHHDSPNIQISKKFFDQIKQRGLPDEVISVLRHNLRDKRFHDKASYISALQHAIGTTETNQYEAILLEVFAAQQPQIILAPEPSRFSYSTMLQTGETIGARKSQDVGIFINLDELENPHKTKEYTAGVVVDCYFNGRMSVSLPEQEKFHSQNFKIHPDETRTEMFVQINSDIISRQKNEKYEYALTDPILWKGAKQSGTEECFTLRIGNSAKHSRGAVHIRNFELIPTITKGNVSLREGNIEDIFRINQKHVSKLSKEYCFDKESREKTLKCSFRHDSISDISDDLTMIQVKCSWDYVEAQTLMSDQEILSLFQNQGEHEHFECIIFFEIRASSGPYWLAVDFGTSAIVAKFDKKADFFGDHTLLDLQQPLRKHTPNYEPKEIPESDTRFLSSICVLNDKDGIVNSVTYKENILILSPLRGLLVQSVRNFVPPLKTLIGTEELPNINSRLNDFRYKKHPHDNESIAFPGEPLKVRTLISNAYRILLRDFILESLEKDGNSEHLHQMIVAVPNAFTPRHADEIRTAILEDEIIKEKFHLKKNQIIFLSESDAVACYYIERWNFFNKSRAKQYQTAPEYVLVYDMGAGTLDITYLKLTPDSNGDLHVTILGRIGNGKAGNYLDFTIAQYLVKRFTGRTESSSLRATEHKASRDTEMGRFNLKEVIQGAIKPRLDEETSFPFQRDDFRDFYDEKNSEDEVLSCTTREIRESDAVQDFLKSVTETILSNFFALYDDIDGYSCKKGELPIDTVLISGRSMQLKILGKRLEDEIKAWAKDGVVFFNIGGIQNTNEDKEGIKTLKSAVVQGALKYALTYREQKTSRVKFQSNNLQARYGFLYKDPDPRVGEWRFKELLNPNTPPLNSTPHIKDGVHIYEYEESETLDLRNSTVVYFVQSYSADTEGDMNKFDKEGILQSNTEYITRMIEWTQQEISGDLSHIPVSVRIDEENQMWVTIGRHTDDPHSMMKINLEDDQIFKNDIFKNSMWPYLG